MGRSWNALIDKLTRLFRVDYPTRDGLCNQGSPRSYVKLNCLEYVLIDLEVQNS